MESTGEDIIIDVMVDGRLLHPKEIPPAVSAEIEVALANGTTPQEILYEGVPYYWSVRPCVFP
jgi:hypothetical protein